MSDLLECMRVETRERDDDSKVSRFPYDSERVDNAAVDCCKVSCANWLRESSCCIKSCVLLNAAVTSLEALRINLSCDSSFCPLFRPGPRVLFPS